MPEVQGYHHRTNRDATNRDLTAPRHRDGRFSRWRKAASQGSEQQGASATRRKAIVVCPIMPAGEACAAHPRALLALVIYAFFYVRESEQRELLLYLAFIIYAFSDVFTDVFLRKRTT